MVCIDSASLTHKIRPSDAMLFRKSGSTRPGTTESARNPGDIGQKPMPCNVVFYKKLQASRSDIKNAQQTRLQTELLQLFLEAKASGAVVEVGPSTPRCVSAISHSSPDLGVVESKANAAPVPEISDPADSCKAFMDTHAVVCPPKRPFRVRVCKALNQLDCANIASVSFEKEPHTEQMFVVRMGGSILRKVPLRHVARQRGVCKGLPVVVLGTRVTIYC